MRSVDSSLLDEWEALADGRITLDELNSLGSEDSVQGEEAAFGANEDGTIAFTRNKHALRVAVRNEMFNRIELLDREDYEELERLDGDAGWDADRWADAIGYTSTNSIFSAPTRRHVALSSSPFWKIRRSRIYCRRGWTTTKPLTCSNPTAVAESGSPSRCDSGDDAGAWGLWALVDLDASDEANAVVLKPIRLSER